MGAVTVGTTISTNAKIVEMCSGKRGMKGASIKTVTLTLPASYDVGGSALDLSGLFPNRVYWAVPQSPFAINASTGAVYIGLIPGTPKTDGAGGFASNDWKVRAAATATECISTYALNAYTCTIVVCGI